MRDRWHLLVSRTDLGTGSSLRTTSILSRRAEWLASVGQSEHARHGVWNSPGPTAVGSRPAAGVRRPVHAHPAAVFLTGARATKLIIPPHGVDAFLLAPLKARLDQLGCNSGSLRPSANCILHNIVTSVD